MPVPGMCVPAGAKTPFMPVRAFGAPQTTWTGAPLPVIDQADAQPVGVRMLPRLDDVGDDEGLQLLGRIGELFELEPEMRQRLGDLFRRGVGVEIVLQPGEGEFHRA